jgi:hypothetical protein
VDGSVFEDGRSGKPAGVEPAEWRFESSSPSHAGVAEELLSGLVEIAADDPLRAGMKTA